jgi:GrpB-like predicted nucleotidyltransferase (UPF0157 family)/RimJ/RimL family protein N-acetyltransferase
MTGNEPIQLVPPNSGWPAQFELERAALEEAIGEWACGGIHHVGSTSVPNLEAKPIIDILVGVSDLATARACFGPLADLDYLYAPYLPAEMHWFCKPDPARRTHHLHLVPLGSQRYRDELDFRDRLRGDPGVASRYAALKRGLAEQHRDDRDAYTEAKSAFVRATLQGDPARFLSTEELTIRQATADDVPNIAEVHVRSWQAAYRGILADDLLDSLSVTEREGRWLALLGNTEHHWLNLVAEDGNGGLAGFCAVTTPSREAKEDELLPEVGALYVDPDRWRERAGGAMLIAACERLKKRGWQEVVLWVLPENRRALAFYARYGFMIDKGVEKFEERSGQPVIRLRASLPLSQSVFPLQKPGDHPATGG